MDSRTEKYEQMIRDGIDRAYLAHLLKLREEIRLKPEDYSGDFKEEAKEIISHVKQARSEIYIIENMENKALKKVNKNINDRIKEISALLKVIIESKTNKIKDLGEIISGLIDDTGPKKDATFLLLNVKRKGINYIIRHSINVCLIAIATAIELTKIMTDKLTDERIKGDFKKLSICNKKVFNKKELIKLGIAAVLHDIGLLEAFPDLNENTIFALKDKSKIELHANKAYHLLSQLKADYDIRQAVFQHHERIDGSGYPDGIKGRLFSKYSVVLAFADQLELFINKNPFNRKFHPHRAIMRILTKIRSQFDNDVILAYCRAASIYPIGSWLLLSNEQIGLVFKTNKDNLKKPVIKCVYTADMKELLQKEFINLSKSNLSIKELIDIEALELLDDNVEKFVFEEREFARIPADIDAKVSIVDSDTSFQSKINDISAGGVRLELDDKLRMGEEICINFDYKNKPFNNVKGIAVWYDGSAAKHNNYGVRFLNIDKDSKEFLLNLS